MWTIAIHFNRHYIALVPNTPASKESPSILGHLAERVRRLRESRGWTRAELSSRSALSIRFLARVEAGDGNISVARLSDLAAALGATPDELLRPVAPPSRIVVLVGTRGAGKSTVGPRVAEALDVPFVEMDDLIEQSSGLPLDQIFELHGERYYRRLERETVARFLARGEPAVLAAAGGVVNEPATWKLLTERATVIWLRATAEEHWDRVIAQGDRRPMADNPDAMEELRAILRAREPVYAQARHVVSTSGRSADEVARDVLRRAASASDLSPSA